ncbi:heterokaryon incompatibility protein [Colletotrichum karsti]|uniref:Heterokaryon incompatibility protein n=1 Tax=Colletotrichum karsti TaxID=1095194 RepID=A0A9P6I6W3_9PEZI|nr:heterokaryon incompatibility protein [Colletotrichum karsti]KAF9877458.1 heterokaryon incompatibility protein [Colletotrichum karsti]
MATAPASRSAYLSPPDETRHYKAQPPKLKIRRANEDFVEADYEHDLYQMRAPDNDMIVTTTYATIEDPVTPFPEVKSSKPRRPRHVEPSSVAESVATSRPSASGSTKTLKTSTTGTLGDKIYRYDPLGESEFRLVRILPARMSKIKCQVRRESISNPPKYVAVSYAWGDAGDTRRLELEGTDIPIPASLHGALDALRQKNSIVTVWVDRLCIDQQNRDEQTQQVQLMTKIYSKAESVAVWLGAEADRSLAATELLEELAQKAASRERITELLSSRSRQADISATVSLFERDYWKRLWVVQEVFNANKLHVYCGSSILPWRVYQKAADVFKERKGDLEHYFPGNSQGRTYARASHNHFTYSQILTNQGPSSLPYMDVRSPAHFGAESLLEVMRVCRRKFASEPKDKVFGILGLLSEDVRSEFKVDYSLSVKEIYTNVVDYLVHTTGRLDVICEAIHFPLHTDTASLPTWVPDWSRIPDTAAIGAMIVTPPFAASIDTRAEFAFKDERRNKPEIGGIEIDTIVTRGITVGTLCTLADYLMAFVHWRALLLRHFRPDDVDAHEIFCKVLRMNQVPSSWPQSLNWVTACYHVFASLIRERLPHLPLDRDLEKYIDAKVDIKPDARWRFLQENFGSRMMGRCFFVTEKGRMGMGSGFMEVGDVVVVPFGCSTPVILRPEGCRSEYRYVGDTYLHGYMYGRAIDQWHDGERKETKFILH